MDPAGAFMVMEVLLDLDKLATVISEDEWVSIYCSRKVAYGCGKHGKELLRGLTLYARRPQYPDLTSSMSIRLTDEAIGSIKAKLGGDSRSRLEAEGYVNIAHQGLLVLSVSFRIRSLSDCGYHLVYDSTDASLCMIPCLPRDLVASYSVTPVPRRTGGQHPQLVLMAHWRWPQSDGDQDLLCLCTPGTSSSGTTDPWEMKAMCFPQLSGSFEPQVEFSFKGNVFWADLSRGLACCNLRTSSSVMQFDFIPLPHGYQILFEDLPDDELVEPPEMNRTICCIEGCIKFVCIDRPRGHTGNQMVKVWTLDIQDRKEWKVEKSFLWKDLWRRVDFLDAELREMEPRYPTLVPDNTLCLMLADKRPSRVLARFGDDCICRFDRSMNLLWHGTVLNYHIMCAIILPKNFFTKRYPPLEPRESKLPARENKLPTHKRKLQSEVDACAQYISEEGLKSREQAERHQDNSCGSSTGSGSVFFWRGCLHVGGSCLSAKACLLRVTETLLPSVFRTLFLKFVVAYLCLFLKIVRL